MDYIDIAVAMGILAAIFALCWGLEIRTYCKSRQWFISELEQLRSERATVIKALREEHRAELRKVEHEAWQEGVRMGAEARRQMRYGQRFHHGKQGKF